MTIRTRDGKIIFYPVQSGRAEELAQTLLLFVEAEYGPDARIVPHVQTNQLMIYVPDRRGDDVTRPPRQVLRR